MDARKTLILKSGRKASIKYRRWLKAYLETGNATEAARIAYNKSEKSNRSIGWENLQKIDYQELLEEGGITDSKLISKLNEGLQAQKVITSHTEPDRIIPDMPTQHKYLETALKLKKRLNNENVVINSERTLILDAILPKQVQEPTQAQEVEVVEGDTQA